MTKGKVPAMKEIPSMKEIKKHIQDRLKTIKKIRNHDEGIEKKKKYLTKHELHDFIRTEIKGFDDLIEFGIPRGSSILVAGGAGTGKTIFCLQTLYNSAKKGEKCLYISFEESEKRLKEHMENFGWDWKSLEEKNLLRIVRREPVELSSNVEAMVAKAKGELLIDINEILEIIPKEFHPTIIVVDSVSAISAAFTKREEGYRIFVEQLFRYFESLKSTSFLISETDQIPTKYSLSGVEEFLADGLIVLYNIKKGDVRVTAIEILKMRGARIEKKLVPFEIKSDKGIEIYPEEAMFVNL